MKTKSQGFPSRNIVLFREAMAEQKKCEPPQITGSMQNADVPPNLCFGLRGEARYFPLVNKIRRARRTIS